MADAEYFRDFKQPAGEKVYNLHSKDDVVKEMVKTGFKIMEIKEHTKEKKCYYLTGFKKMITP
jgi:hypothetical protein